MLTFYVRKLVILIKFTLHLDKIRDISWEDALAFIWLALKV